MAGPLVGPAGAEWIPASRANGKPGRAARAPTGYTG